MNKRNKLLIKRIIIIIVLLLIIKLIFDEYTYIEHMFQYLFMGRPWDAIPLPKNIKKIILKILNELPTNKYTFIDFGCAEGNVIDLVYKQTDKAVCVELEKELTDKAEKRFKDIKNIQILNQDMNDYKYTPAPTILFLYEPLWSMKKEDALPIYKSIFEKIPKDINPFYIIYVSGIKQHLSESFFNSFGFKTDKHYKLKRFLGLTANNVFVFSRNV